jgi:hypothetical protein
MRIEVTITGNGLGPVSALVENLLACASKAGLKDARADYSYGNKQNNPPMFATEEVAEVEDMASEMSVQFASVIAARKADAANLDSSAFADVLPSGKRGYTTADVEAIISLAGR